LAKVEELMRRLLAVSVGVITATLAMSLPVHASTVHARTACILDGTHASVHFTLSDSTDGRASHFAGLRIEHLSATGCLDPLPVTVTIRGTPSGDPTQTPIERITVLDSATDPCTGARLANPQFLVGGGITLMACPSARPVQLSEVHDATRLIVRVAGMPVIVAPGDGGQSSGEDPGVTVLGEKSSRPTAIHGEHARPRGNLGFANLPFTGSWIARTVALSSALVLLGLVLALVRRRRTKGAS
jgi:hypothetical protein